MDNRTYQIVEEGEGLLIIPAEGIRNLYGSAVRWSRETGFRPAEIARGNFGFQTSLVMESREELLSLLKERGIDPGGLPRL